MEKLYCLIRVAFQTKFAYIKAFWFNIFGTAVSILIYYFLWKYVFYVQRGAAWILPRCR